MVLWVGWTRCTASYLLPSGIPYLEFNPLAIIYFDCVILESCFLVSQNAIEYPLPSTAAIVPTRESSSTPIVTSVGEKRPSHSRMVSFFGKHPHGRFQSASASCQSDLFPMIWFQGAEWPLTELFPVPESPKQMTFYGLGQTSMRRVSNATRPCPSRLGTDCVRRVSGNRTYLRRVGTAI